MQKGRQHSTAERQRLQHCRTARNCRAAERLGTVAQHEGPLKAGKCSAAQCIKAGNCSTAEGHCSPAERQRTAALHEGKGLQHYRKARSCCSAEWWVTAVLHKVKEILSCRNCPSAKKEGNCSTAAGQIGGELGTVQLQNGRGLPHGMKERNCSAAETQGSAALPQRRENAMWHKGGKLQRGRKAGTAARQKGWDLPHFRRAGICRSVERRSAA